LPLIVPSLAVVLVGVFGANARSTPAAGAAGPFAPPDRMAATAETGRRVLGRASPLLWILVRQRINCHSTAAALVKTGSLIGVYCLLCCAIA
jgi:hypothetical protein